MSATWYSLQSMNAETIKALYWESRKGQDWHGTSGKPEAQHTLDLQAWDVVIAAIRKDYEIELERLRTENRDLQRIIMDTVTADAQRVA